MGQVSVIINDRAFRLACDAGDEPRLAELAQYVKAKVEQLTAEIGHSGDERLMLMAALLITDELWDARKTIDDLQAGTADPEPVRRLKRVAAKMRANADAGDTGGSPADQPDAAVDQLPKARSV